MAFVVEAVIRGGFSVASSLGSLWFGKQAISKIEGTTEALKQRANQTATVAEENLVAVRSAGEEEARRLRGMAAQEIVRTRVGVLEAAHAVGEAAGSVARRVDRVGDTAEEEIIRARAEAEQVMRHATSEMKSTGKIIRAVLFIAQDVVLAVGSGAATHYFYPVYAASCAADDSSTVCRASRVATIGACALGLVALSHLLIIQGVKMRAALKGASSS